MNNVIKKYLIIWIIVVLTFSAICFLVPTDNRFSSSFWIAYFMIILSFGVNLAGVAYSLKDSNITRIFYNIPIINIVYIGLVLMFIVTTPSLVITFIPNWLSVVSCIIVLSLMLCAIVFSTIAADSISDVDKIIKKKTLFIDLLTADSESLIARADNSAIRTECENVYKAVRYSDPVSNDILSSLETQITIKFSEFSEQVKSSNEEQVKRYAKELLILLDERNKKCKVLK